MRPAESARAEGIRVAVDVLGGDHSPAAVVAGTLAALHADPGLVAILVGPAESLSPLLRDAPDPARVRVVVARDEVAMAEPPVRAVRGRPDVTVRVAAELVRDGAADAMVTVGSTGAAVAAALFSLGRLPGISRPALAAVVPALRGPVVLLDVGATADATAETLAEHAALGAAYARARLGIDRPRVGLLTVGKEVGKGDLIRKAARARIEGAALAGDFIGNVEGADVPLGGVADVVVVDGFTGNVLLKGLEGALGLFAGLLAGSPAEHEFAALTGMLRPERCGGALLLGVDGVVAVGHGASAPDAVCACIGQAAAAVRSGLLPALGAALGQRGVTQVAQVAQVTQVRR